MAYMTVEAGEALTYKGVTIYYSYKKNNVNFGVRRYWYGLDPLVDDEREFPEEHGSFDVRDVEGYDENLNVEDNLIRMIERGTISQDGIKGYPKS